MGKTLKNSARRIILTGVAATFLAVPLVGTGTAHAADLSAPGYGGTAVVPGGGEYTFPPGTDGSGDATYDPIPSD